MLYYNEESGEIQEVNCKEAYCVFLYGSDEDCTTIIGKSPLIYYSENELRLWLENFKDMKHYLDSGLTPVIRKVNLFTNY